VSRPRSVHPVAWWIWALGLGWCAIRTTDVALLVTIAGVAGFVVSARRSRAAWGNAFRLLVFFGLVGIVFTIGLQILIGTRQGGHGVLRLPEYHLPSWTSGLTVGGPVTAESLLAAGTKALRLAVLLACFGAANSLAHPGRLLKLVPAALYELGVAVVVALTFIPQMTESLQRVRDAQRLRGRHIRGLRSIRSIAVPVLEESLDRAISLAASMDSRGYGRSAAVPARVRHTTNLLLLLGLAGALTGSYFVVDPTADHGLGVSTLVTGTALAVVAGYLTGRRVHRTNYRPDPWSTPEWLTVCAAAIAVLCYVVVDPSRDAIGALSWPTLPLVPFLGTLAAALPGVLTPSPVRLSSGRRRTTVQPVSP
jgi:energy-coupling factor transport system permease protein